MRDIVLIAHNLRSVHNVGSLLRTADGIGVSKVFLTGYTPYPLMPKDERLPHMANKLTKQIQKTALGAESSQAWDHNEDIYDILKQLRQDGFVIAALEQSDNSVPLSSYKPAEKIAIIVGREVEGIEPDILKAVDVTIEIPMFGQKESFNVVQAAAMGLYHLRFLAS
jgi:23S rRNA (guanosine2251-2'-O)-methyltransferase